MVSRLAPNALFGIVILGLILVSGDFFSYQIGLYLTYAIAVLGVQFAWGSAGILPLGHALFFGLSGYIASKVWLYMGSVGVIGWLMVPIAGLFSACLAYLMAWLVFRKVNHTGPYFAVITLAMLMLFFQLANSLTQFTGGYNGLLGFSAQLGLSPSGFYICTLLILVGMLCLLGWLRVLPFGTILAAIISNEERMQFLGYATYRYKAMGFAISAFVTGVGGALFAAHQGYISPQSMGLLLTTEFLIWTALGGRQSLLGPVLAVLFIGLLTDELRQSVSYWEILIALIFIIVVMFYPKGLAGLVPRKIVAFFTSVNLWVEKSKIDTDPVQKVTSLNFTNCNVTCNNVHILRGLNLSASHQGIMCLIGPNGAGKSSTFHVATGKMSLQTGDIAINETSLNHLSPFKIFSYGLGMKFQLATIFTNLTVRQNLLLALWAGRLSTKALFSLSANGYVGKRQDEFIKKIPEFKELMNRAASELSQGQKQQLELLMVLSAGSGMILLDEPCAGLSPQETKQIIALIDYAATKIGCRILIIEHDMGLVKKLSDHIYVLHNGTLLMQGNYKEV
ncbi:MAG: ATP-binding cassette domain-containing protein, partial [Alphaproteobacteria bacterium]|nr:ATP-binding cassette domain-containing protein [Alphaproteobacteria bacterium]